MTGLITCCLALAIMMTLGAVEAEAADVFSPEPSALDQVAQALTERPGRLGPAAGDRQAWRTIAKRPDMLEAIKSAEALLGAPLPEITDELYMDYSKTGNRRRCEAVLNQRRSRIPALALAECLEAKGRFLPKLEETLRAICAEKSWVLPAHDGNLQTFSGKLITIDLASSALGWSLGMVDYLLGDRLSPDVRSLVRGELEKRIFKPYRRMCAGEQAQYWLVYRMNWNSVCLAGVTGAALTALEDRRERAWYVLAADHYSRYPLEGFTADGYCDEGVSYWNYGFGHYAALAETVRRATDGAVDLMDRRAAVMPSAYGFQIEIVPGICPAFADCPVTAAPGAGLTDYLSRRYTGKPTREQRVPISGGLCDQVMALFPVEAKMVRSEIAWPTFDPLRTWFDNHSMLIGRPAAGTACRLSVAWMGGHNAQNHNHNDVGVFMAVVGKTAVLPDIGAEVYTRRTFSAQRYASKALNSWGHAVPVVAGQLQRSGRNAEARILSKEFTPERDRVVMDIRSAYPVTELQRLERALEYDRTGAGRLTVTDTFAFEAPATFETALLTFGKCEKLDERTLRVTDGDEAVLVTITAPDGATVEMTSEQITEDLTARRTATRIGIKLKEPLAAGALSMTIVPAGAAQKAGAAAPGVEIIAHRGESFDAPENTMAAFRLAWERGNRTIELDTHLTADGHLVVCHDADTKRTTGVSRAIAASTLDELRALDAGSWKGAQWAGERLPRLSEALEAMPDHGRVWIEVKAGPETVDPLLEVIRKSGKRLDQIAVISFKDEVIRLVKERNSSIVTHLISGFRKAPGTETWEPGIAELIERGRAAGADGIDVHFGGPVTADTAAEITRAGFALSVWTVDTAPEARRMIEAGVRAITSNRAAWLRSELDL